MHPVTVILMAAIAVFAYLLLHRRGLLRSLPARLMACLLLAAAFGLRLFVLDHETLDYQNFLSIWVQYFRDNGGVRALSQSVGNYNVPYLYFLALFSYIPLPDLHLIKLLSILFDVVLAYYVMLLVGLFTKSEGRSIFTFFLVLFLPTVFLNGAYWGQCDSIYVAFAVMSFYYALTGKPWRSMAAIALSFAFKLQAIFLFPIYLVFLFAGKIRLRHFVAFPLTYLLVVLPAVFAGRPLVDTLLLYVNQAETVGSGLNYNSPSLFAFVSGSGNEDFLARLGIIAAFLLVFAVYLLVVYRGRKISDERLLTIALIFAAGIPLLLPHMHDRYFFMADLFAVAYGMARLTRLPAVALTQFASLLGYHAYLRGSYLLPMRYGTVALLLMMILLCYDFLHRPRKRGKHH